MNLILLYDSDFYNANSACLEGERFTHITKIHRATVGDSLRVGKLNGLMGTATITTLSDNHAELSVALNQPPPEKLPLTIILALPRPKMLRRIFRSVTELGVEQLIIINSQKVEKSFWNSPALAPDKVTSYLHAGLQQAKDTVPPKVIFERLFKPFVEDRLPTLLEHRRGLIAHPRTELPCPFQLNQACVLAIGPEGGFSDYEVDKFIATGCDAVHMGERILRVENAITALTSRLFG